MSALFFNGFRIRNRVRRKGRTLGHHFLCAITDDGDFDWCEITKNEFSDSELYPDFNYDTVAHEICKALYRAFHIYEIGEASHDGVCEMFSREMVMICDNCREVYTKDPWGEYANDERFECKSFTNDFIKFFRCERCVSFYRWINSKSARKAKKLDRTDKIFFKLMAGAGALAGSGLVKQ